MRKILSAKIKFPSTKRAWHSVRDEVWIAWFFAAAIWGASRHHGFVLFAAGLNAGIAIEKLTHLGFTRALERSRRQDLIDLRTMHDLVEKMSYDMLHKMEKGSMN